MNYEKLSGSIRAVIDRRPGDDGAYSDLFSLCREWETEDFSAAHKVNKELLALSADQVVRGGGVKFYEQWRRCLLFEAPHDFDSFMTYITFQLVDCLKTTYSMNGSNTNVNGWRGSTMRTSTMATLLNQLSSDLKSVLKFVNKVTSKGNNQSGLETTSDKLFLLSEIEVFGATQYSYAGEGKQYEYYTAGNSTIKKVNGSANYWWERSPRSGNTNAFCDVASNGNADTNAASASYGVSFGFCV